MIPELLYLALDFYREPRRFDALRSAAHPLPPGVSELLAAPTQALGDAQIAATAQALNATPEECRACVPFFIKQVLLEVDGDHYRVLGLSRDAGQAQVKEHYFYLMRLFHPDRDTNDEGWDDLYAPRINEAYNILRKPARRAEYDATLAQLDGFNPGEIARGAPAAAPAAAAATAAPSAAARPMPPPVKRPAPGILRSPWLYGGLAAVAVLLLVGLLLADNQTAQLAVTAPPQAGQDENRAVFTSLDELQERHAAQTAPQAREATVQAATRAAIQAAAPTGTAGGSDARIEALVQARVERATRAVLGAPKPRPRPAPATEPVASAAPAPARDVAAAVDAPVQPGTVAPDAAVVVAAAEPAPAGDVDAAVPAPAPVAPDAVVIATATEPVPAREVITAQPETVVPEATVVVAEPAPADKVAARVVAPVKPVPAAPVTAVTATPRVAATEPTARPQPQAADRPAPIADAELTRLLDRFVTHYTAEDAAAFAALFAADAYTTDASGRAAIRDLYAGFFADRRIQSVSFERVRWRRGDQARDGSARVSITSSPATGGASDTVRADIDFRVRRGAGDRLEIARMTY